MVKREATLGKRGVLTIPVDIRRALGLKAGDEVILTVEDGKVRVERSESAVAADE